MQYGHCICLKLDESFHPIQSNIDLQQKETGSKTVAIATSKYASCGAFLSVQCACQLPVVLHHYLQRYSLFCVLTSILSHPENVEKTDPHSMDDPLTPTLWTILWTLWTPQTTLNKQPNLGLRGKETQEAYLLHQSYTIPI